MEKLNIPKDLNPFVKEIVFIESNDEKGQHKIPFYADGFAGIAFSKSNHPFVIQPQNKILPNFYLYGQTIIPMTLEIEGAFELYAIRLFPFAVKTLINVDPILLNDECYDLSQIEGIDTRSSISELQGAKNKDEIVASLIKYFNTLIKNAAKTPDHRVVLAANMILKSNGIIRISEIQERLHITERTMERQFKTEMGVTAKQFAKIIQFHSSVKIMTEEDYINLTDVAFQSSYTDQSHFIRSFKKYTGKAPKEFLQLLSS